MKKILPFVVLCVTRLLASGSKDNEPIHIRGVSLDKSYSPKTGREFQCPEKSSLPPIPATPRRKYL